MNLRGITNERVKVMNYSLLQKYSTGFSYGISNLDRYMLRMVYRKRAYLSYISKENGINIDLIRSMV